MNRSLLSLLAGILSFSCLPDASGQKSMVLADSFRTPGERIDLSVRMIRQGFEEPVTAFERREVSDQNGLSYFAQTLNSQAIGACGYSLESGDYMAHSCIDYSFPVIDRSDGDSIVVEFDALWDQQKGSGESGRLVAFLMHEYPGTGPGPGSITETAGHPYGRPAHSIRLLNGSYGAFMCYGGGADPEGEFELFSGTHWLPGFASRAGGGTIGQGENYPLNSFMEVPEGTPTTSVSEWMHYTWVIDSERQTLFWRRSGEPAGQDELLLFMEMPEDGSLSVINAAHGPAALEPPPNYHWFDQVNGLRIYWRGVNNFCLANLTVTKSGIPVSTYVEFQRNRYKVRESAGSYPLALVMDHPVDSLETTAVVELWEGNGDLVGGFTSDSVVFTTDDRGARFLELPLVPDENETDDTLVFRIRSVSGGRFPTAGVNRMFTLIVSDDVGTTTWATQGTGRPEVYPVPADRQIHVSGLTGDAGYTVYDATGKLMIRGRLKEGGPIGTASLPEGIYLILLEEEGSFAVRRICISR